MGNYKSKEKYQPEKNESPESAEETENKNIGW